MGSMMTATGKLKALEITRDGAPITVLNQLKATFTLNGQSYSIRLSGTRNLELRRGDEILAFAKGIQSMWSEHIDVTYGDKSWLLKADNMRATRYGLYDGATRLGGITAGGWFVRWNGATIDLPDALPLDAQLFVTSVVMSKWCEGDSAS
jgi:hypothetical protein